MIITKKQAREMLEAATPLMEWLKANGHPHCTATVDSEEVELHECLSKQSKSSVTAAWEADDKKKTDNAKKG